MLRFEQLKSVLDEILCTFDLDKLLRSIVENLQKLGFDRASVFLIDEDRQVAQGTWGTDGQGNLERISGEEHSMDALPPREGYYVVVDEEILKEKLGIDAPELFLKIGEEEKFQQLLGYMPPSPGYYKRVELGDNFSFPIVVENKTIGLIAVDNYISHRHINEEYAQLFSMFVSLASIAIQKRQNKELEKINKLGLELNRQANIGDISKTLFRSDIELLSHDFSTIGLIEGDYLSFKIGVWEDFGYRAVGEKFRIKIGEGITGHAVATGKTIVCQDVTQEPRYIPDSTGVDKTLAELVVPLKSGERILGVLDIHHGEKNCFSEDDVALAETLAQYIAAALERAELFEEVKQRNKELEKINRLGLELNRQTSIDGILEMLFISKGTQGKIEFLDYGFASISLVEGDYLSFKIGILEDSNVVETFRVKIGEGLTGHAVATGKTIVCQDVTQEPRYIPDSTGVDKTLAELVVPLKSGERILGVLDIHHGEKNCFSEDDVALAETLAQYIAAALERAELFEKLRDSEEMYRALVHASPDAIIMSDLTGKIIQANPQMAKLGKFENESELIGLNSFDFIARKDQDRAREDLEKTLEAGFMKDVEYTCLKTDGTQFPAELSVSLIRDTEEKPVAFVGILKDITKRKELEEQLLQKQKLEAVGELAGGIAHDFNNILTGITGYTSLMMMQMNESHSFYNAVKTIQDAGNRAAELTQQLLGFARGGKYLVQPVNLNDNVKRVLQLTKKTFDRAIDIETNLDENLSFVEGDPGQLEQVLLNLCLNARDAMPAGGKLTIETSNVTLDEDYARRHLDIEAGEYVLVQVTDTGMGMSSEVKQRIFEPFFSTKEEGTGMGLSMVYGIVKNHDGAINVYSEAGKGSTFRIYLQALEEKVTEEETKLEGELSRGSESVLFVDDEEHVRNVGREMLENFGYRVYLANNGIEACKTYSENKDEIELVLLDIIMPEMGGRETYSQLKKIDSDVRVVLVSGYSINEQIREILNEGAMDFIQKPFDIEKLASIVRQVLDRSGQIAD